MDQRKKLNQMRLRRKARSRARVFGTASKPRLSVFRSHNHIYAQLIDDSAGKILAAVSSLETTEKNKKTEIAKNIGALIGKKALELGLKSAVFDRGRYQYHGRVAALADGARTAGLKI